jgi:hypothetical protein
MKRHAVLLSVACLFVLSAVRPAAAGPAEIELKDGSKIVGEIVSSDGGVYRIRSGALGTLEIGQERIKSLRFVEPGDKAAPAADESRQFHEQIERTKDRIASDKELSGLIASLQQDPDFQDALKDPEIMAAISSGDIGTLLSHPKMIKLMSKPEVLEIGLKLTQ